MSQQFANQSFSPNNAQSSFGPSSTASYSKETRVFVNIDQTSGSINFSLSEASGKIVHKYVHKSPWAEHDHANTNEAIDEGVGMPGGGFSFTFPIDQPQKSVKGALFVREEVGTTTYTWELSRQ